jgi:hypothetical protein
VSKQQDQQQVIRSGSRFHRSVLPEPIAAIVGKPPILSTESPEQFWSLLNRIALAAQPLDTIEWFAIWFETVKIWEVIRLYRTRVGIVDMARLKVLESILEWVGNHPACTCEPAKLRELAAGLFNRVGKARDDLMEFLATLGIDEDAITAEAIASRLPELERIDRMIAVAELGRNTILRETLFYRMEFVKRFRGASQAVTVAFNDLLVAESGTVAGGADTP